MKDICIVGAGGFGREVLWLIQRINERKKCFHILGFVDDHTPAGTECDGYPVLGSCEELFNMQEVWVVVAVGAAKIRRQIVERLSVAENIRFATLVDPSVMLSDRVTIGEGTIICAGTILTVDIQIGKHVILNLDCTVGHDAVLGDFTTVYPSANISGCVTIGACTELGTGMQIIQGKTIGEESIIGAGTVVIRDIPAGSKAVGNPARIL